ncbi:hypothetical protein CCACVL1_27678 [Corchorus capsularis]|uniref:K Homology domain-containing protein n=1 Tax=Corchorus capsularis TaxID=210143 RepID=A0A1R3G9A4_COCAP|nr:hypothetical protein CCACVL1_27678 [Corchorus capsularis]
MEQAHQGRNPPPKTEAQSWLYNLVKLMWKSVSMICLILLFLSCIMLCAVPALCNRRDDASAKEFSLCLVCPVGNIGGLIGIDGGIIKQIRQESGTSIKVDSYGAKGHDCIMLYSYLQRSFSKTHLLPSMLFCACNRNAVKKLKENQITGALDVACNALLQIISRLRANLYERDGAPAIFLPVLPYIPMSLDMSDGSKYGNKDGQPSIMETQISQQDTTLVIHLQVTVMELIVLHFFSVAGYCTSSDCLMFVFSEWSHICGSRGGRSSGWG